jgi:hypothetical protein
MDLLSAIGQATKRRGDFFSQAERLAKKYPSQPALEEHMMADSMVLSKGLRDKQLRFEEYERSLIEKTLIAALAAVFLGSKDARPKDKMEKAWPTIVGEMMPPLVQFLTETKTYLDNGILRQGDKTLEFDELTNQAQLEAEEGRAQGKTWPGLYNRVSRYLATPTYSYHDLGKYYVMQEQGFSEMRRVAKNDKRSCPDCKNFDAAGWQPIGGLPMPGRECRCYDHCRCFIEYR